MQTKFWPRADEIALAEAADVIKQGGLVAFPTETVYGLGADGLSGQAVRGIFTAKGRPPDNPLILHIADTAMLGEITTNVPVKARLLMDAFWPGPLTLVLEKTPAVPDEVTAGLSTVAVRMPQHPVAQMLITLSGRPLAAPSANISGRPSPTVAEDVLEDLEGRIQGVIDGGAARVGLESTVVDCTLPVPVVLRPGRITLEQLSLVIGEVAWSGEAESALPKAPGMKYRHYAPKAPLYLLSDSLSACELTEALSVGLAKGTKIGMVARQNLSKNLPDNVLFYGWEREEELAAGLYKWLRELDKRGAEIILVQKTVAKGLGQALMNRLHKASGGKELSAAAASAAFLK